MSSPRVEPIARTEPRDRAGEVGRILVVDDEPIIREVLQEILTREGHALTMAPDAESGLKALQEGEYDLVLLDLMLPGMGGLETLKEIRELDPDLVVVMVTAYGSVETAVQAMRMGAHDYLTKPFKNEDVLRTLRHGLRHRRLLSENRNLRKALLGRANFGELIGKSRAMRDL